MASLETLRGAILLSLEKNRSLLVGMADYRLPELAGALANDFACFIATEATPEAFADIRAPTEDVEPTDGGFGARHVGRPGHTVADTNTRCRCLACHGGGYLSGSTACPRCKGTGQEPPHDRMFSPFAYGRPGGMHWLDENEIDLDRFLLARAARGGLMPSTKGLRETIKVSALPYTDLYGQKAVG